MDVLFFPFRVASTRTRSTRTPTTEKNCPVVQYPRVQFHTVPVQRVIRWAQTLSLTCWWEFDILLFSQSVPAFFSFDAENGSRHAWRSMRRPIWPARMKRKMKFRDWVPSFVGSGTLTPHFPSKNSVIVSTDRSALLLRSLACGTRPSQRARLHWCGRRTARSRSNMALVAYSHWASEFSTSPAVKRRKIRSWNVIDDVHLHRSLSIHL